MRDARQVVIRPVVTEKSIAQTARSQYTFAVAADADRRAIAAAVETIFKVHVVRVNTARVRGKRKHDPRRRMRRPAVAQPDWKKAVVTLRKGERIELGGVNYFES